MPTMYTNATFLTMDRSRPQAEALLVEDDRILAVGTRVEIAEVAGANSRTVDLHGGTVIPGFNDCHCHVLSLGLTLDQINVHPEVVDTLDDIVRVVGRRVHELEPGTWIQGGRYDQNQLAERRHPTRHDLDRAAPENPVVLWHTSGHALACNSRALQRAGISNTTPTPPGGNIVRDEHGEPTGVLFETPAMDLLTAAIDPVSETEGTAAIIRATEVMASQGITSASDAASGEGPTVDGTLRMYRAALDSGRLVSRITLMPQIRYVAPPESQEVHHPASFAVGDQSEWLSIGATKIFSDGAMSTRTAALRQPYADEIENTGILLWERETMTSMMRRAHSAGWQIATHALGDRAVEFALDCYEHALAGQLPGDYRHRIEHSMVADEVLARRMQRLGIVACLQPDIFRLGDGYIHALGIERASQVIPMAVFRSTGVSIALSSDAPVVPGAPLLNIQSAVQRLTPSGVSLGPEHRLTAADALHYYTLGGAYAAHLDGKRGILRSGALADFVLLSQNPTTVEAAHIGDIDVVMTVVGGTVQFAV